MDPRERRPRKEYTPEEDARITHLWTNLKLSVQHIGQLLDRAHGSINQRIHKLGLPSHGRGRPRQLPSTPDSALVPSTSSLTLSNTERRFLAVGANVGNSSPRTIREAAPVLANLHANLKPVSSSGIPIMYRYHRDPWGSVAMVSLPYVPYIEGPYIIPRNQQQGAHNVSPH